MTTKEDIDEMLDIIKEFNLHINSIIKNKYNNDIESLINLVNIIDEYYKSIDDTNDTDNEIDDSDFNITASEEENELSEESSEESTEEETDEIDNFINGTRNISKYNIYSKSSDKIKTMKDFIKNEF
jgi:hypothetical protein